MPHLTPLPTTQLLHLISSLAGSLYAFLSFSFFFFVFFVFFCFFVFVFVFLSYAPLYSHPLHRHFHITTTTTTTIIFSTRSPENCCEPINTFTSFFEVKISKFFGGFYTFAWGYFYVSFNNDIHVIYEHWKWYLCVFMYRFCIGGIIWWVGI